MSAPAPGLFIFACSFRHPRHSARQRDEAIQKTGVLCRARNELLAPQDSGPKSLHLLRMILGIPSASFDHQLRDMRFDRAHDRVGGAREALDSQAGGTRHFP